MGRKPKNSEGITDEQKEILTNLRDALSAALGGAPAADAGDGSGGDDGLGGLGDNTDDLLGGGEPAADEPTEDDVRENLKKVIAAYGKDGKATVAKLLKKLGAGALSELEAEKYAEAIELCGKVIKAKKK